MADRNDVASALARIYGGKRKVVLSSGAISGRGSVSAWGSNSPNAAFQGVGVSWWAPLFANGEDGWLFPSFADLTKLFTTSGGSTSVAADTDPVGQANDQSGRGNNVAQATTTRRPLWRENGGKPYLSYDGTDDVLVGPFLPTSALTVAAACRPAGVAGRTAVGGGNSGTSQRIGVGVASADAGVTLKATLSWGNETTGGGLYGADLKNTDHVLLLTGDAVSRDLYVDGVLVSSAAPSGTPTGSGALALGGRNNAGSPVEVWNGPLYAGLALNRRATLAEIALITSKFQGSYQ